MLTQNGLVNFCLVVGVDVKVPSLEMALQNLYPPNTIISEGAGCVLVANDVGLQGIQPKPSRRIKGLRTERTSKQTFEASSFYDSNAIELIAKMPAQATDLLMVKPDGSFSEFLCEPSL